MKQSVPDAAFVPDYLPLPPRIDPVPPRPEADVPPAAAADVVAPASRKEAFLRLLRRPMFLVAVLIPNLLSILYFGLIASPVYVSTASLVVRNPQKSEPSLPTLLAGADGSEKGGYLLKSYFSSWQAFTRVEKPMALARNFAAGDFVSRYGGLAGLFRTNDVALWQYLNAHVDVDIDEKSGIVSLRVEGYRPDFSHGLASALLKDAIAHLDVMNAEQEHDYVDAAIVRRSRIERALQADLAALARFRRDVGTYDPRELYTSNLSLLNGLALKQADLDAQRAAISAAAPNNPVARNLGTQISSVEGDIAATRSDFPRMADSSSRYEKLLVSRDNNVALLNQANVAVQEAQLAAEKNRYYLNVISTPSQPHTAEEPRRLLWIGGILMATLLLWGVLR